MAQIDQALIDSAVSHGYTREEAIAHYYGTQQSSDSSSADWALKQGQQNIANQPASLEKLKEPDVKGAVTEMVPAAANTAKAAATSAFQDLDNTSTAIGVGTGVLLGYGLHKTLGSKMAGSSNTPTAPATPAPVAATPTAAPTATPTAPTTPVQTLQQRLGFVPKVELSPEEKRQERLKTAGTAAEQEMTANAKPISAEGATPLVPAAPAPTDTPLVKVEPPPAAPVTPTAPTTTAEVVTNPNATPVEKAVTLTQEAPVVPPSVEQKVAELNSRILSSPVAPPETSIATRRTPAQMEVFKSENPLNKGYNQVAAAAGITPNTPHEEANKFMNRVTDEVFGGKPPASQGGAAPQAKQITNFIESNANEFPNIYQKLKEIQAKYPTQSGFAHLQMLANLGFNVLGGLGLYHDYKEGKKTGDWSNLGLDSIGQVLGNVLPKASGLGANLMLHHEEAGHGSAFYGPGSQFPSAHTYEQYLQASKIGAGRGMQGVPPPTR